MTSFYTKTLEFLHHDPSLILSLIATSRPIFNCSMVPYILKDETLWGNFSWYNQMKWFKLFYMSDSMQFSSRMDIFRSTNAQEFSETVLRPLLTERRYFSSTLKVCTIYCDDGDVLLPHLAQVRTLEELKLRYQLTDDTMKHLKTFPNLQILLLKKCDAVTKEGWMELSSEDSKLKRCLRQISCEGVVHLEWLVGFKESLRSFSLWNASANFTSLSFAERLSAQEAKIDLSYLTPLENLIELKLNTCSFTEDGGVEHLAKLTSLGMLTVDYCKNVQGLSFLEPLTRLEELEIRGSLASSYSTVDLENDIQKIISKLLHLTNLSIEAVSQFQDRSIELFQPVEFHYLEIMRLSRTGITNGCLQHFQGMNSLTHLSLSECGGIGNNAGGNSSSSSSSSSSYLHDLVYAPNLEILEMRSCNLVDEDLAFLDGGRLKNLAKLDLDGNEGLCDKGIAYLKDCVSLKSLVLNEAEKVTDINCLVNLVNLTKLSMRNCSSLTNEGIEVVFGGSKRIGEEHSSNSNKNNNTGDSVPPFLFNLKFLDFYNCVKINDKGVEHVSHLLQLQNLNLENAEDITDVGLQHLSKLRSLSILNLSGKKKKRTATFCSLDDDDSVNSESGECVATIGEAPFFSLQGVVNNLTKIKQLSRLTMIGNLGQNMTREEVDERIRKVFPKWTNVIA